MLGSQAASTFPQAEEKARKPTANGCRLNARAVGGVTLELTEEGPLGGIPD